MAISISPQKFSAYVDQFLLSCEQDGNSQGELAQKRMALTNHLVPYFGEMLLDSITRADTLSYKVLKQQALKPKTINNHLIILSRFLHMAREDNYCGTHRFEIKRLPLNVAENDNYLTTEQRIALLAAARKESDKKWYMMIEVCLHTGLRVGELLALRYANVDGNRRLLKITHSYCRSSKAMKAPKNYQRRDVALSAKAFELFVMLGYLRPQDSDPNDLIFTVSYEACHKALGRIAKRAGLASIGWHTLRHTFASILVTNGAPLVNVSRIMGHHSVRVTERYAHLDPARNADTIAILNAAMA